jgi:DNA-binding SARP family transcriptional activator/streptogramin lyase
MEFRILGPVEVLDVGRQLDLGGAKQRALLALLLLNANRVVSTQRLIEDVWGEQPPETASAMLRNYVSRLRKELNHEASIETRAPGYVLRVDPGCVDLEVFQRLYDEGRRASTHGDARRAAEAFRKALALWRGPALADLAGTVVSDMEGPRLEELRRAALAARIEADLGLGRDGDLIAELERLVREEPHDETFCRQLMLALYRAGRRSDALAAYRDARRRLVVDLGIEPGPELHELEAAILKHDPSLAPRRAGVAGVSRQRAASPRLSRRTLLAGVAALTAAALAAALSLVLVSGGSANRVRPSSIAILDASGRVVADVGLQGRPTEVAAGPSGVWASTADETVERVDPASHRVTGTIGLGLTPTDIAVGRGALWIASEGYLHRVLRVTPGDGDVQSISLPVPSPAVGRAASVIAAGDGALVADGDRSLFRVGILDAKRIGEVANGFGIPGGGVAVGAASIWVSDPHGSLVSRVDPRSGSVIASIPLGSASQGHQAPIAFGGGAVWVALAAERTLFQIDPASNAVVRTFRTGPAPSDIAVGGRAVWVTDASGAPLTRIDLGTETATTIQLGQPTVGVAVANGRAWVAIAG